MMPYNAPPTILQLPNRHGHGQERHHHPQMVVNVPINPYQRVQQIIQAISRTVPQSQRTQVLESTLQFLSHNDTSIHDYEIDMGADRALCLQLGYLDMLHSSSPTNSGATTITTVQATHTKDQTLICWCLTRIFQCSREYRLRSFQDIGKTDLIPILVKILKRHTAHPPTQQEGAASILVPVLQTIRIFAKLDTHVKSSLIRWKDGRLISALVDILGKGLPTEGVARQSAATMEAFAILKDLSFRLGYDDKEFLYRFLKDILIQYTIIRDGLPPIVAGKVLEAVAAIYWNIATTPKLSFEMGQNPTILKSLDHLLRYRGTGYCTAETVKTPRNALSALGNIVAALTGTRKGVPSSSSLQQREIEVAKDTAVFCSQSWIRPRLQQLLQEEPDKDIQRRVMRTIRCLASCSWGRVLLWDESGMDSFLALVLDQKTPFDLPTKIQIYETLGCLTQDEDTMKRVCPTLTKAFIQTLTHFQDKKQLDEEATLITAVCKAFFLCLERNPKKACPFPLHKAFFAGILACSKVEPELTHPPIAKLLLAIASQERDQMSKDCQLGNKHKDPVVIENAILSTPVLDTITELLQAVGPSFEHSQADALDLIQIFLQDSSNKKVLAANEGLLTALVGFALIAAKDGNKKCAKQMILALVPEL